jgi:hypothetical protein
MERSDIRERLAPAFPAFAALNSGYVLDFRR